MLILENMKKIKLFICLFLLGLTQTGCVDFLDNAPDNQETIEDVFEKKSDMEQWFANIYAGIPDPYWDYIKFIGYDTMGDDITPSFGWTPFWDGSLLQYRVGNWSPASNWGSNMWASLPQRRRSAFIFMERAHPLPNDNVTQADIDMMKNECRFLNAYYLWRLTEAYGAVPYFEEIVSVDAGNETIMKGQPTFDEMVDYIDKEMVELSGLLPDKWDNADDYGRATSIMCLAVRARMLLFAASPLVNGNDWYAGFKNYDGRERFNSTYDSNKWKKAVDACKLLIDKAHAAGHELYKEYNADGSLDAYSSVSNVFFKSFAEGNTEILFARPNCQSGFVDFEAHCTPRSFNGNGGMGVTQEIVDAFFMNNGLSPILGYNEDGSPIINDKSGYVEKGFSTEIQTAMTKWNVFKNHPEAPQRQVDEEAGTTQEFWVTDKGTYNMYCNREPRFYTSVLFNGQWFWTRSRKVDFLNGHDDGGPTHDAPQNGYLNRKKVDYMESNKVEGRTDYRPGILYRLGEAYLNYAEALNECEPGNSDIMLYVNKIRNRAGIPEYGTGTDDNGFKRIPFEDTQDNVRELIRKERRVELCCEGIRFNDLRRWKLCEEYLNGYDHGMNFGGSEWSDDENNKAAFFKRTPILKRVFQRKQYWFPINQTEVDKDPTLVQAPFWYGEAKTD